MSEDSIMSNLLRPEAKRKTHNITPYRCRTRKNNKL